MFVNSGLHSRFRYSAGVGFQAFSFVCRHWTEFLPLIGKRSPLYCFPALPLEHQRQGENGAVLLNRHRHDDVGVPVPIGTDFYRIIVRRQIHRQHRVDRQDPQKASHELCVEHECFWLFAMDVVQFDFRNARLSALSLQRQAMPVKRKLNARMVAIGGKLRFQSSGKQLAAV